MLIALLAAHSAFCQNEFVLLRSNGHTVDSLPVMEFVPDTAQIYKITQQSIAHTFMGHSIKLYHIAQQYLINNGELAHPEPAYLAITTHEGGFAKTGFVLNDRGGQIHKPRAHYVDLTEHHLTAPPGRLQSISQLYPHELMHVMFKMLSANEERTAQSYNVNMHYFSVITDYNIAFNEGLAESMENIARLYEPSDSVRQGIQKQAQDLEPYFASRTQGFRRDLEWPLRLNYYKASMLVWYSQFEDYKRYVYARGDQETFKRPNALNNVRDAILLRNAGVDNPRVSKKNQVQGMASEGFVSTFFTHLAESSLPQIYRQAEFYRPFMSDSMLTIEPKQTFSPIENLFVKYFHVLHRYVKYESSERSQLLDFIDGYCRAFPDEGAVVKQVYKDLADMEFSTDLPPPLWFLVKEYEHSVLVIDPFAGLTVPLYTFDINIAEAEDLMTVAGFSRADAELLIVYRDHHGLFRSYEDVFTSPAVPEPARVRLRNHVMDAAYFNSLDEETLNIRALIVAPLVHLLYKSGLYFLILLSLLAYLHPKSTSIANKLASVLKYFFLLLFFVLMGLAAVIINGNTMGIFFTGVSGYMLLAFIVLRKKKPALLRNYAMTCAMIALVLYSLA